MMYEFIQNKQGAADISPLSKDFMVAENNVILNTPKKPNKLFQFETPDTSNQELSQFKDTILFLSPAHKISLQYSKGNQIVRNCLQYTDIGGGAKKYLNPLITF